MFLIAPHLTNFHGSRKFPDLCHRVMGVLLAIEIYTVTLGTFGCR